MIPSITSAWKCTIRRISNQIKFLTKPSVQCIALDSLSDITRSRADLMAENALLRQQLTSLKRQIKRHKLSDNDRLLLVLLARCTRFWKQTIFIIQPDTLLRWHRDLFRFFWRWKSKSKTKKVRVSPNTIALIKKIASENPRWGAERIRGELLKLGIPLSEVPRTQPGASKTASIASVFSLLSYGIQCSSGLFPLSLGRLMSLQCFCQSKTRPVAREKRAHQGIN